MSGPLPGPGSRVYDPTAAPRECPFATAAVPAKDQHGHQRLAFVRGACNEMCALYDRAGKRNCLERLEALLGTLKP